MSHHPSECVIVGVPAEAWVAKHWKAPGVNASSSCKGAWITADYGEWLDGVGVVVKGTAKRDPSGTLHVRWLTGKMANMAADRPADRFGLPTLLRVRLDQCRPATAAERAEGIAALWEASADD